jgi:uncharacterized protein (DUF2249 family)
MSFKAPIQSLELEIDLRLLDPHQRNNYLIKMFALLPSGEGFVFIDDKWPSPHIHALQQQFWGRYEWHTLDVSSACCRVALSKRYTPMSPLRQVIDTMTADHRRIEQLLLRIRELAHRGDWQEATILSGYLETGLKRHLQIEEQALFPLLLAANRPEEAKGTFEELQQEHQQMLCHIRLIQASAFDAQADLAPSIAITQEIRILSNTLFRDFFKHEHKEKKLLYAPTDMLLDRGASDELLRRIQRMS